MKTPRGWEPEYPEGCWMKDRPAPVNYSVGFKMFDTFEAAQDWAGEQGGYNLIRYSELYGNWGVELVEDFYG